MIIRDSVASITLRELEAEGYETTPFLQLSTYFPHRDERDEVGRRH